MGENDNDRPIPSPRTLAGTLYLVNAETDERYHAGQFIGIEGYDPDKDKFGFCTELGEHGILSREKLETGIQTGAFVKVEHRDRVADFIEFDMDIEGETIEIGDDG